MTVNMSNWLALTYAKRLIACESITPARGSVFDALEAMLLPLGFTVERFIAGEGDTDHANGGPAENLFAIRSTGGRHFSFAGHLDVVPPGDGWASDPFVPHVRGDLLHGRGAVDMKGSIAAFVAALHDVPANSVLALRRRTVRDNRWHCFARWLRRRFLAWDFLEILE